jgi:Zn-dependent protease/CBS domain-containing protein
MGWSISLGRIAGIRIYVHFTFLILLAWFGLAEGLSTGEWGSAAIRLALFGTLAVIIVLHELGHALAAKHFGIRTRDITLLPIGGVARLERMPDKPLQELVVALAGPAVNVVLAVALVAGLILSGRFIAWENALHIGTAFVLNLVAINVMLAVFNLLPAFPMDGGRVLRAILALGGDYVWATTVAARIGQLMAIGFFLLGMFGTFVGFGSPMLLLIALFVWIGAEEEADMVRTKAVLSGVPVGRLMATHFQALRPDATIAEAADWVAQGFQQDFPIVEEGRVVGMIAKPELFRALAARVDPLTPLRNLMRTDFEPIHPLDTVETALARFRECQCHALPVVHRDQLVGMLTVDRVSEFLMIRDHWRSPTVANSPGAVPPSVLPASQNR